VPVPIVPVGDLLPQFVFHGQMVGRQIEVGATTAKPDGRNESIGIRATAASSQGRVPAPSSCSGSSRGHTTWRALTEGDVALLGA
jgi:hypothetical protein